MMNDEKPEIKIQGEGPYTADHKDNNQTNQHTQEDNQDIQSGE